MINYILYRETEIRFNDHVEIQALKINTRRLAEEAESIRSNWSSLQMALDLNQDHPDRHREALWMSEDMVLGPKLLLINEKRDRSIQLLYTLIHNEVR